MIQNLNMLNVEPPQEEAIAKGGMTQEGLLGATVTSGYILFAVNRGLLGEVTPNLRKVVVDLTNTPVNVVFYYEGPLTGGEYDTASRVASRINSWLPDAHFRVTAERLDYPRRIPSQPQSGITRAYAYARWEPAYNSET